MNTITGGEQATTAGRWEWRLVQPRLPIAEAELERLVTGPARDSAEVYLLSPASPHNVKIRGDRLEIKQLEAVHSSGLEQWRPVLRSSFPMSRGGVAVLNTAMALGSFAIHAPVPDASALLHALPAAVQVIPVTKRRRPIRLEGCPGEWVELQVLGRALLSLSLEHEEPARILAALHARQLHPDHNTSYPTALRRLSAGVPPMSHIGA